MVFAGVAKKCSNEVKQRMGTEEGGLIGDAASGKRLNERRCQ